MKHRREFNLLISGVGGQGTITASHIIGKAALASGLAIIIGEIYGASMRGGAVVSHLRMGDGDLGPVTPRGRGDILLGFEPLESLRAAIKFLSLGGIMIVNTKRIYPIDTAFGNFVYPPLETILKDLNKFGKLVAFDATSIAKEVGSAVATNIVMIGALAGSALLPIPLAKIVEAIERTIPSRAIEISLKAFNMGLEAYKTLSLTALDKT